MKRIVSGGLSILILALALVLQGCLKSAEAPCTREVSAITIANVDQAQLKSDIAAIDDYLTKNSITAIQDPSGLRYVVTTTGDDTRACIEKAILVKYTGKLMSSGTVFDSTDSKPETKNGVAFPLYQLILGWQIGFTKIGKGAKATLYIPSGFGYGKNGSGATIPPNSNLIFEVELIDIQQ